MIIYELFQQIVKLLSFYFLKMFSVKSRDFYIKFFEALKHKVVILLQGEKKCFLLMLLSDNSYLVQLHLKN